MSLSSWTKMTTISSSIHQEQTFTNLVTQRHPFHSILLATRRKFRRCLYPAWLLRARFFTELGLSQETPSMSRTSSPTSIPTERGLFSATPSISRTAAPLPTELGLEDLQTPAPATPRNAIGMDIEEEEQKPLILGLQKLAIASNTRSGTHTPVGGSLGPAWIKQRALNVHWFQDLKPKIGAENPVVRKPKHTSRCESTESFALFHYHVFDPEST
ncbi:PHD-type domain-containing protein [Mycena chlorophos]|uniref:PHD-type domain-containing protein n=1 Tax=Mycena chlorophos TaxID=658473 RepID=A0A8H6WLI6_MYCCL|nr:PHD-type domain-containing protein [Mycena chlorophos]